MELKILKFGATWCQPCRTLDPVMKDIQKEYSDLSKQLSTSHTETIRTNQIDLKNNQIEVTQKLREHKLKSCEELVKEFNMMLLKTEDYRNLNDTITRVNRELDDLKKKFESSCNSLRQEEKAKYDLELKRQQQQQEFIRIRKNKKKSECNFKISKENK